MIWWVSADKRLSARAARLIEQHARGRTKTVSDTPQVLVSAISCWEIAMLVDRGRLSLALELDEWLAAVQSIDRLEIVAVSPRQMVQSVRLPGEFHRDPADRMIVALALERDAVIVTADEKIRGYQYVRTVW